MSQLNKFEMCGVHESSPMTPLDILVLEHLETQRKLRQMKEAGLILRLVVEGFTREEISKMIGLSVWVVSKRIEYLREAFFGKHNYKLEK